MPEYKLRNPDWNYGGDHFVLFRSKIDLFLKCPRCFYLDNKLGIKRPADFPLNINNAIDTLFKKEFDQYRKEKKPHPIMTAYGIDAIPFDHEKLSTWRDDNKTFEGIRYQDPETGFIVAGMVDDIWVNSDGELIVADYKSTSKEGKIEALDADWQIGYKRQMEVYQWLLRKNGFKVSNTGYFVYANAKTDVEAFNNKLEFETTLVPYEGDDSWVEETLKEIKKCLDGDTIPLPSETCDDCKHDGYKLKTILEYNKKGLLEK